MSCASRASSPLLLPSLLPCTSWAAPGAGQQVPSGGLGPVAPSAWELTPQVSVQLPPSLGPHLVSMSPAQKGPSCASGKSRASCCILLPSIFHNQTSPSFVSSPSCGISSKPTHSSFVHCFIPVPDAVLGPEGAPKQCLWSEFCLHSAFPLSVMQRPYRRLSAPDYGEEPWESSGLCLA